MELHNLTQNETSRTYFGVSAYASTCVGIHGVIEYSVDPFERESVAAMAGRLP